MILESDRSTLASGMVLFDNLPTLRALGQERLQQLCAEWLATDDARACNVTGLTVGDAATGFALYPESGHDMPRRLDERLYNFTSSLLAFLVTHGLPSEEHHLADRLLQLMTRPPGLNAPPPGPGDAQRPHAGFRGEPAGPDFTRSRRPMLAAQAHADYSKRPEPVLEPPRWLYEVEAEEEAARKARQ